MMDWATLSDLTWGLKRTRWITWRRMLAMSRSAQRGPGAATPHADAVVVKQPANVVYLCAIYDLTFAQALQFGLEANRSGGHPRIIFVVDHGSGTGLRVATLTWGHDKPLKFSSTSWAYCS